MSSESDLTKAINDHMSKFPKLTKKEKYSNVPSFSLEVNGKQYFIHVSPYNIYYEETD